MGRNGQADVDSCLMNSSGSQDPETLQTALRAARENENRWLEMSAEFSFDSQRMEQWMSTAKLRRLEVERIDALLADMAERSNQSKPVCEIVVEMKDQVVKTGEQIFGG